MVTTTIARHIGVLCITATSFPSGIMDAHQKQHELIPYTTERKYFGISRPENGGIVYKAAAAARGKRA